MDGDAASLQAPCPVCGGGGAPYLEHQGFALFRCPDCRTVYIDPPPTAAFLAAYYQDRHPYYFDRAAKKLRRWRNRMRWLRWFGRGGRFLDIGCHGGLMVEAAREAGFAASGLDLDADAIAHARAHYPKNTYYCDAVETLAPAHAGEFSLIHCAEVIEHVPDGKAFVAAIFTLLRPGGYVYFTTPDISHPRRPKDVLQWDGFIPPNHLVYYNPGSLSLLLAAAGFRIVWRRHSRKPQIRLLARKPG
jgi:SAM-dependent methyltransferase